MLGLVVLVLVASEERLLLREAMILGGFQERLERLVPVVTGSSCDGDLLGLLVLGKR
jgi:hypothetical protein